MKVETLKRLEAKVRSLVGDKMTEKMSNDFRRMIRNRKKKMRQMGKPGY